MLMLVLITFSIKTFWIRLRNSVIWNNTGSFHELVVLLLGFLSTKYVFHFLSLSCLHVSFHFNSKWVSSILQVIHRKPQTELPVSTCLLNTVQVFNFEFHQLGSQSQDLIIKVTLVHPSVTIAVKFLEGLVDCVENFNTIRSFFLVPSVVQKLPVLVFHYTYRVIKSVWNFRTFVVLTSLISLKLIWVTI